MIFKLQQGASIRANVDRSMENLQNQKIMINFWHCWGDRVMTKINGRTLNNNIIKRIKPFDCFDFLIGKLPMRPISTKVNDTLKKDDMVIGHMAIIPFPVLCKLIV